jgi:3-oxoacyl-[acyl-carrier protein] reductase
LRNRNVLVTGANNPFGIGAAIAFAFAKLGARLYLHYHTTPPEKALGSGFYHQQQAQSCDAVIERITSIGGEAHAEELDFRDLPTVPDLLDHAERVCGHIDVLVNNAAAWKGDTFLPSKETSRIEYIELWTDASSPVSDASALMHFTANTCAPALLIREFAKRHIQRAATWGRVINISTAGSDCFPSEVSYGASKFALESFTRSAATELGQFGITVNALALGPVQTGWITPELERAILPTIPLGRIGTPDDVADAVVFLASEQANWITGQKMFVSGGHRI